MMLKDKKKKLKCYNVGLNSDVFAIGLVEDPAIEMDFIALAKHKPLQVFLEREDKHMLVGAVLVPNKPIYRNQNCEEFYVQFSSQTIEKLAHDFLMSDRIHSFTEQHEDIADNVAVVESWIKLSENDKSVEYGIDAPIGTWFIAAKVDNDDLWAKVKNGELNGFSVEAFCNLDEINLNIHKEMNKDNEVKLEAVQINDGFWDKLKQIIADALGKPQESQEVEKTVGEIVDQIEVDAVPKDEKPKVVEQAEAMPEEVVPKTAINEIVNDVVQDVVEQAFTPEQAKEDLQSVIDGLNAQVEALKAENEELKKQNQKLSKQPSTKPIKAEMKKTQNPIEVIDALRNGTYFK